MSRSWSEKVSLKNFGNNQRVEPCEFDSFMRPGGSHLWGKRGRENEARKVAMYLVKRYCDRTLPEMAKDFGVGSNSTSAGVAAG